MLYSGGFSLLAPALWAQQLSPAGSPPQREPPLQQQQQLLTLGRHGGVVTVALAAVLHMGLASSDDEVLRAVLRAMLVGDAAQLLACGLIAADHGHVLDQTNAAYVVLTLFFAAVRLAWLRREWRGSARRVAGKQG